jgi:hypothetical protein
MPIDLEVAKPPAVGPTGFLKYADLVVKNVAVKADQMPPRIDVTIVNKGLRDAGETRTAIIYVGDQGVAGIGAMATPAIPVGGQTTIHFGETILHAGDLLIFADAPWGTGTDYGKEREQPLSLTALMSPAELNNVFMVPFQPGLGLTNYANPSVS